MSELRLIIAGSRAFNNYDSLVNAMEQLNIQPTTIISGTARGADRLGERYAKEHNIKLIRMPADWNTYGKSAGYLRNKAMAERADMLIALWDGISPGTQHMINIATAKHLTIHVIKE